MCSLVLSDPECSVFRCCFIFMFGFLLLWLSFLFRFVLFCFVLFSFVLFLFCFVLFCFRGELRTRTLQGQNSFDTT